MDNGLCTPRYPGCTNSRANNYGAFYNVDDGSCKIGGCQATDSEATYNVPCLCTQTCAANSARRALPLGASRLPTGTPSGRRHVPVGRRVGLSNCDSKSEWEHGGAARTGQGGASARRGDLAGSHSPARVGGAPLPCARHFLWGTFLNSSARAHT